MFQVDVKNFNSCLDETVKMDEEGCRIVALAKGAGSGLALEALAPKKMIAPHYHTEGDDFFAILSGEGLLYTAEFSEDRKTRVNIKKTPLKAGDVYAIPPGVIHGIENTGNTDLCILNCAPPTHLTTDYFLV